MRLNKHKESCEENAELLKEAVGHGAVLASADESWVFGTMIVCRALNGRFRRSKIWRWMCVVPQ